MDAMFIKYNIKHTQKTKSELFKMEKSNTQKYVYKAN